MDYRIPFAQRPWEEPMPGLRCKRARAGARRVRLVEYTPALPPHWCERGHLGYVLEGEIEIEFPTVTHTFRAGDGVLIASGPEHRHRARPVSERVVAIFVEDAEEGD